MRQTMTLGMALGIFLLHSCGVSNGVNSHSIQKRKYTKGWYIAKRGIHKKGDDHSSNQDLLTSNTPTDNALPEVPLMKSYERESQDDLALMDQTPFALPLFTEPHTKHPKTALEGCDIIMLKDGRELSAKVLEIGSSEIKYKMCDNTDGPSYTLQRYEVFKIKYANGTSELISEIGTNNNSQNTPVSDTPIKALATSSLVLSAVSIPISILFGLGTILSALAVILAIIALILLMLRPREQRTKKLTTLTYLALTLAFLTPLITVMILVLIL